MFIVFEVLTLLSIHTMNKEIESLLEKTQEKIVLTDDLMSLEHLRTQIFGKKGQLTHILQQLSTLPPEERASMGQVVNQAKQKLTLAFKDRMEQLKQQALHARLTEETLDITLPGRVTQSNGSLHPVTRMCLRIEQLFGSMGFSVLEGEEIDNDYHNFAALNIPEDHPARSMHDTFYFPDGSLLRTHTSNWQNRVLKTMTLPLRVIIPGRVYRCDYDQTHTPMFHQLEGLVVDDCCTFADLKGLLKNFLNQLFERESTFRFRPSYFPFTEPSAEMDMTCVMCEGKGCRVCSHTGWLEVLGCGMIHPNVLRMGGIDPERYSGFAFGAGIDRFAMLRYGIDDLRKLFENDVRFLEQFD